MDFRQNLPARSDLFIHLIFDVVCIQRSRVCLLISLLLFPFICTQQFNFVTRLLYCCELLYFVLFMFLNVSCQGKTFHLLWLTFAMDIFFKFFEFNFLCQFYYFHAKIILKRAWNDGSDIYWVFYFCICLQHEYVHCSLWVVWKLEIIFIRRWILKIL